MPNKKRSLLNGTLLAIVSVPTIHSILSGRDSSDIADAISKASLIHLFMGVGCIIPFIWMGPATLHYLFATLSIKTKGRTCFLYPSVGFFFNCITSLARGGQPVQIYYIKENMISMPVATMVPMVVAIAYKSVLVVVGCLSTIFGQGPLNRYLYKTMPTYYLGLGLNVASCAALLILASHISLAKDVVMRLLGLLEHFYFLKRRISRIERLLPATEHYNDTAAFLCQHKHVLLGASFLTLCQRLVLSSVTYSVYRTFELKRTAMLTLMLLQSMISVPAGMLPLPRGMGVSKYLFLTIFDPTFYGDLLLPAMVLSRSIVYYVQLGFSAVVTMYAHLTLVRKHRKT